MKTVDIVAITLTFAVALILISTVLGNAITGRELSEEKAQLVGNLVSSCIAIVSMYVGSKMKGG